jgi:hypothetical protein
MFSRPRIFVDHAPDKPASVPIAGDIVSDDFAPADVYDVMGKEPRRR